MGLKFTISEKKPLGAEQNAQLAALQDRTALNNIIGRKVTRDIIRHFQIYSASHPNKLGGRRTNFVSKMGDATSYRSDKDGTVIRIDHEGARLRIEGGTVTPKNVKYLTIPAVAAAYGKRAREFNNLKLFFRRKGGSVEAYALGIADYTPVGKGAPKRGSKRLGKQSGQVMYWLVRSANIPANRDLLLSDEEILNSAVSATRSYLAAKGGAVATAA